MKEVYLLRHGEKDDNNVLTANGEAQARARRNDLPDFAKVIASPATRCVVTAKLLTGQEPLIDERAGVAPLNSINIDAIDEHAKKQRTTFLEAALVFNDHKVLKSIRNQAEALNQLVDEVLSKLEEDERALIVSHNLTICPAVERRGMPLEPIDFLYGFIVSGTNTQIRRI